MFLIHAFVIDDDPDTIKKMETYSKENPGMITIVGSAKSIPTSHHALSQLQPDLIILRASNDNFSHLESLRAVDFSAKYICIGVKENAYQAFKLEAVDFLVFPFDTDEFTEALHKVKYAIEREAAFVQLINTTLSAGFLGHANKDFFVVSSIDKIEIIKFTEVLYCKADGKYTEIFLQNGTKIVSSKNIGEYQQLFPSHYFFRIHNSTLINVHHIVRINKKDGLYCELNNGHDLPVAKRKEREFLLYLREN
jgi:two-component system, LytTR family, response regulator